MNTLKSCLLGLLCLLTMPFAQSQTLLTDIHGGQIPFDSLKGKWVLINYWASWCQPCLDEIRELNAFYESHQNTVALFAVNFDDLPADSQRELIKKWQIRYPSLLRDPGRDLGLGDIRGVPATFVFNPEGQLTTTLYGGQTRKSLRKAVAGA